MRDKLFYLVSISIGVFFFNSCAPNLPSEDSINGTLFTLREGITFQNTVQHSQNIDVFRYRNFYNGGGVSIGDINQDGLADIYLTANLDSNKLFLNKGNWQFEDITLASGTWGMRAWSTGVTMADVNGDGLLDIYVCNAGNANGDDRENELFINNGDLTFDQKADEYGLADPGWSTHAAFLDYDLDGDLDCYVLNNSFRSVNSFDKNDNIRHSRHALGGDRLYRNDAGKFQDVSIEAGILGSEIAFGLGITLSDFNLDGWPDLYISNDFFERDYLYVNNQNGTFKESLTEQFNHISQFSMGADAADLNNDGYPEIFVTDMLPKEDVRLKTSTSFMTYDVKQARLKNDYYNQYMRNSLQLNNKNGTFSEVGLFADVAATDWSWGAIIADFDNSGSKEIFVTNGISRDVINQDFLMGFQEEANQIVAGAKVDYVEIVERMPPVPLSNSMFKKDSLSLTYKDVAEKWGLADASFSNGAAYGDLDNDGDLDLVVNNVNQPIFLYENTSDKGAVNHYLKLRFSGYGKNTQGLGAKVWVSNDDELKYYEHYPIRGFQSSMDYVGNIGLGKWEKIDELKVEWPGGKIQILTDQSVDQLIELNYEEASSVDQAKGSNHDLLVELKGLVDFDHQENAFVDFDYNRLLLHMNSRHGPALSIADLNQDGLDDFFIGGAKNQPGGIYIQNKQGKFSTSLQKVLVEDRELEDVDSEFVDIDNDGDLDLYVVSGGSERGSRRISYEDRLYLNIGTAKSPRFQKSLESIPRLNVSGSCVEAADYDNDGDMDLFIGTRLDPEQYGVPVSSILLENNEGVFKNVTSERIPQLARIGMVADALWHDYDKDGLMDLFVVGEWMPITVFKNRGAGFQKMTKIEALKNSSGLWNTISKADVNNDGELELLVGNLGLNSRFHATPERPFRLYINDFDQNGALDHIYAHFNEKDRLVPFSTKHQLMTQLPHLKKKYLKFSDYADQTMEDVFGSEGLTNSLILEVQTFSSKIVHIENGNFQLEDLPEPVQYSTANAFLELDIDKDGKPEQFIGGNFSGVQPELGQYDSNFGLLYTSSTKGLVEIPNAKSGLNVRGDVKHIASLRTVDDEKLILFAINDKTPVFYKAK